MMSNEGKLRRRHALLHGNKSGLEGAVTNSLKSGPGRFLSYGLAKREGGKEWKDTYRVKWGKREIFVRTNRWT